ncbi:MAG TPA: DUF6221 family protein [Pseudonocardia sp.]
MDLATFLLARLAEDEQAALTATYCQEDAHEDVVNWHLDNEVQPAEIVGSDGLGIIQARTQHPGVLAHIARHDPARVLAEVEAKRRIVDAFVRYDEESSDPCESCWAQGLGEALRLLALPYADHPECHPSWLPAVKT